MEKLVKLLQELNLLQTPVEKYTLLIDEKGDEHGALFFIEAKGRSYKVMLPTPHHKKLLADGQVPTAQQLLQHKEAMVLK